MDTGKGKEEGWGKRQAITIQRDTFFNTYTLEVRFVYFLRFYVWRFYNFNLKQFLTVIIFCFPTVITWLQDLITL